MRDVEIIVRGPVGSGKSAICGEIEIALRSLGVAVRFSDEAAMRTEKNATHADWQSALDLYKPSAVIREELVPAPTPAPEPDKWWSHLRRIYDALPKRPRCRDCADEDGTCPGSGYPCDPTEEVIARLKAAEATALKAAPIPEDDVLRETREQLALRLKTRIDAAIERDGGEQAAVTGRGIAIGYLLASEIYRALTAAEKGAGR